MKNKIFPERYGMWDPKINLVNFKWDLNVGL